MKIALVREQEKIGIWELSLYNHLEKHGVQTTLIFPKNKKNDSIKISYPKKELISLGNFNKIPILSTFLQYRYGLNGWMFGFNKIAKEYDILSPVEISSVASYQSVKTGIPTVVKVWENIPYNWVLFPYSERIRKVGNPKYSNFVVKNASLFLPISERSKDALLIHGVDENKIKIVPEPVDTDLFKPLKVDKSSFRKKHRIKEHDKILLYVGRLSWEKGLNDLLFTMKSLSKVRDDVKLIMIGDGPLRNQVDEAIDVLGIKKYVVRINGVDFFKLPEYYNQADIFVLPSIPLIRIAEQFGKVLTEAMACGVPVVSTYCGGISEVVEHGKVGLLVPSADRLRFREAVLKLLDDESLREDMGKKAREYTVNKFGVDVVIKKLVDAYKSVL